MNYIKARLGEHSTQLALGGIGAALCNAFAGTISWQTAMASMLPLLVPLLLPAPGNTAQ